jgi:hypothetical protein
LRTGGLKMSTTYTNSTTNTYTEARARYVMGKVYEDFIGLMTAEHITKEYADRMRRELFYLLDMRVLKSFQLQFTNRYGTRVGGINYEVRSDSTIAIDDQSGGIDFWGLDDGTTVNLFITKDLASPNLAEVNRQLIAWGWGSGSALTGSSVYAKSYASGGFGVKQSIIGTW